MMVSVVSFSQFLADVRGAADSEDRFDRLFTGRGRLCRHVDGELIVDLNTEPIEELEICGIDVDAFITHCLRNVPLLPDDRVRFHLSPPFSTGMTRLDYGTYEHNNTKMAVKNYHHTLLFTMEGQCHLDIHIVFPNMNELGVEMNNDATVLDSVYQAKFVNELFLPAVKVCKKRAFSSYNRCGGSYEQSAARGVFNPLATFLQTEELPDIIELMRDMVREKESLAIFRHFRFVLSAFGFKAPLREVTYRSVLSKMIDWSNLSPVHVRVDIALNFFAVSAVENRPIISFLKEEFCSAAGKLFGGEGTTAESHGMCLGRFGGMSALL
ncbi:hypothetical protein INT47_009227 [Mucor saturninus]|uniref:Uncharacterized protein n=1 Tax=Mucor saturninus TaxID=64648 RepID=A0A8H7QKB6_9FUNG|nr:hypothetical protein INT47_009227 [Mucor saturninus]